LDTYQNTPSFICFPSLGATGQCVDVCEMIETALEEAEGKVQRERMERLKQQGVANVVSSLSALDHNHRGDEGPAGNRAMTRGIAYTTSS